MLLMVIMSVIGIAAITITGLENQLAGFGRSGEQAASAAESCIGTAVNIIQQTIDQGSVPNAFLANASPAGPVPIANQNTLTAEIMGQTGFTNYSDTPLAAPNTLMNINNYVVQGDIDRLYAKLKSGSSSASAAGYEGTGGGAAGGGIDIVYQISCVAANAATNVTYQINAVYACTVTGESCQRQF
jgi:Tfp pilus assembly protein PilX